MDQITQKIYDYIIEEYKIKDDKKRAFEENIYAYEIEGNLSKLEACLCDAYETMNLEQVDLNWFLQWLPFADDETKEWYVGFEDYQNKLAKVNSGELPQDTELNHLDYDGSEYYLKQKLLYYCKPIRDKIIQMCEDKTLYNMD